MTVRGLIAFSSSFLENDNLVTLAVLHNGGFGTVTYLLARMLVHGIRYISLANLILDRQIFKELIQSEASPYAMFSELCSLIFDRDVRERILSDYRELVGRMGECGAAGRVASAIVDDCKK